ncbi:MAG: hypothetical protein E7290_14855 [Lachnospiraceae bacterium]|nr:hypothetical protein [Lachnospiraceae bacterium]
MRHEVNVILAEGNRKQLLVSKKMSMRDFILRKLFGEARQILVLKPGETVEAVKIIEVKGA